jgi:hypothetical protein
MREVKPYVFERKPRMGKDGNIVAKKCAVRKSPAGAKRGRSVKMS